MGAGFHHGLTRESRAITLQNGKWHRSKLLHFNICVKDCLTSDEGRPVVNFEIKITQGQQYRKIPRIIPPFDAQKSMPKMGGGLTYEDLTFGLSDQ